MWKVTKEGKLVNRLRNWRYDDEKSIVLPKDGTEGVIALNSTKGYKVLIVTNGTDVPRKVDFFTKQTPGWQTWKFSDPNNRRESGGWRTLTNTQLGLESYLTTNRINEKTHLTVDKKGNQLLFLVVG